MNKVSLLDFVRLELIALLYSMLSQALLCCKQSHVVALTHSRFSTSHAHIVSPQFQYSFIRPFCKELGTSA
jgi:hypothetical protein